MKLPYGMAAPIVEIHACKLGAGPRGSLFREARGPCPMAARDNQRLTDGTETQARAKVPTAQGAAQIASHGAIGGRLRP